jgi:hypothetical protein
MKINHFLFDCFLSLVKEDKKLIKNLTLEEAEGFDFISSLDSRKEELIDEIERYKPNKNFEKSDIEAVLSFIKKEGVDKVLTMIDKAAINKMIGMYLKQYLQFKKQLEKGIE